MTEPTTTVPNFAAPPVKDFTRKRERIVFRIDDDLFEAATAIPGDMITEFATRYADIGDVPVAQQLAVMRDVLGLVLLPESHARFIKRLSDVANPIELEQTVDVVTWLLEHYGRRPAHYGSREWARFAAWSAVLRPTLV